MTNIEGNSSAYVQNVNQSEYTKEDTVNIV